MPKRSSNSPAGKSVVAILLVTVVVAGGLAGYVRLSPKAAHVTADERRGDLDVAIQSKPDDSTTPPAPAVSTSLFVPSIVGTDVKLGKEATPAPDGVRPEVNLANLTLQSLHIDGARAVGVDIHNHVAMMDFNAALQKGYGSIEEGHLIKSLQMALGQFKDIKKFQIVIEGKAIDSLGNIDLSAPIDVIRPGDSPVADNSSDAKHPDPN